MTFVPQSVCDHQRVDFLSLPPHLFVASLVQFPMMPATERHSELVTHFEADRSWLCKSQVMRIGWLAPANDARFRPFGANNAYF
jgi:hypothetical protein